MYYSARERSSVARGFLANEEGLVYLSVLTALSRNGSDSPLKTAKVIIAPDNGNFQCGWVSDVFKLRGSSAALFAGGLLGPRRRQLCALSSSFLVAGKNVSEHRATTNCGCTHKCSSSQWKL